MNFVRQQDRSFRIFAALIVLFLLTLNPQCTLCRLRYFEIRFLDKPPCLGRDSNEKLFILTPLWPAVETLSRVAAHRLVRPKG